jgi:hypothetical protein
MRTVVKRVPHGTSTYQAAWIPDFGDDEGENLENEDEDFNIDIEVDKMDSLPSLGQVEKMEDEGLSEPKKGKRVFCG